MKKVLLLLFLVCMSCMEDTKNDDPILFALSADSEKIQNVMQHLDAHEIQIMVTDAEGTNFSFQVNDSAYFYPASSVKFPVALAALEKVNRIPTITSETAFMVEGDSVQTTIRKEVQKIFAVSDNEAYNRLFEFLGKEEIHNQLKEKGFYPSQIVHRLSTRDAANLHTKTVTFNKKDSILYFQPSMRSRPIIPLTLEKTQKGNGFYRNDSLITKPMDFSKKNYLPISTLHELMKRLHRAEKYDPKAQFNLTESDREFLLKIMHETPKKQGFTDSEYYDSYVKFFMFGDTKEAMPEHIKIYNKVGYAYGYLTDCAHIVDTKNDISFTITATIHVNKNQIFNDDTYEYDEIGIPFLAELGRQVHQFYLNKNHKL
ncbi:beta-lactamase enzyme family protein [Kordia sp. SMS9]|uniref:serine hydrolase n=1 Tax=Kordia sp. SMS9 TaxID=2282170 RepID=UPI000E0CF451|nr:serine hydrolase [Kordia sp. SMS9]AXG70266.1 beta-lactamase enzyme family protein [Kordia sp. SMS9]